MTGSSAATASPRPREQRGISHVHERHGSPACVNSESSTSDLRCAHGLSVFSCTAAYVGWRVTTALCCKNTLHGLQGGRTGHGCFSASGCEHRWVPLQLGVVLIMFLETGLTAASVGSGGKTKPVLNESQEVFCITSILICVYLED